MAIINGRENPAADGRTIGDYLAEGGYNRAYVAVERNGSIVKKADYDGCVIDSGDKIEIVSFVGGG